MLHYKVFFVYLKNLKVEGSCFCSWRLKVLDFILEGGRFLFLEIEGSWFMFCEMIFVIFHDMLFLCICDDFCSLCVLGANFENI